MNYSVTQRGLFLAQSTQKAQMLQTVFNIGYEKFEDTQCRFFQAQSKSTLSQPPFLSLSIYMETQTQTNTHTHTRVY